jgi:hypothetical protein
LLQAAGAMIAIAGPNGARTHRPASARADEVI